MRAVLGVDGGGTKTLAVVADETGRVLGLGRAEGTNYQGVGLVRAGIELKDAIDRAIAAAGLKPEDITAAGYGISGADREKDFDTVNSYVEPANPAPHYILVNDTTLALRAGTTDGVGVAMIAGTGSNTIGFNEKKEEAKVGGMGPITGDYGSAADIAMAGIVASAKSLDGRGPKTILVQMFCEAFGAAELLDLMDFTFVDNYKPMDVGIYAPVVFKAANKGDRVALAILRHTGRLLAHDAITCIRRLFPKDAASIHVVLGGSVFQKGENPTLVDTLTAGIKAKYPQVKVTRLTAEPVFGAVLFALDALYGKPTPADVAALADRTLKEAMSREPRTEDPQTE